MSMMLMLMMMGRKVKTFTQTFTANSVWVCPAGVSLLDSAVGRGASGTPEVPGERVRKTNVVTTYTRRDGGTPYQEVTTYDGWIGNTPGTGYCEPSRDLSTSESTVYSRYQVCYRYITVTSGGSSATTGASASGFGKSFPGGVGGPATNVSYLNIAVVPGTSYSVIVPSGGVITITWKR